MTIFADFTVREKVLVTDKASSPLTEKIFPKLFHISADLHYNALSGGFMDPVSIARSAASVDQMFKVLQSSQAQVTEMSEKLLRVAVEAALGKEAGKGELIDLIA